MSYPQPNSNISAIQGYQFFRLNTPLSSPGDIYESEQSCHAVCVGPDSDIANINVAYFDQQTATFMQHATVSPSRALVGRIDARNEATYTPSKRPGRILFWADDLYDPAYRPSTFGEDDTIEFIAPQFDVIQYFKPIASLGPPRSDKEFAFQDYNVTDENTFFLVIPSYGRKYCFTQFTNRNINNDPNTYGIIGVNYAISTEGAGSYHQETVIRAPAAVAAGTTITKIITAGSIGVFDALVFSFTDGGPAPLRILLSDNSQGT